MSEPGESRPDSASWKRPALALLILFVLPPACFVGVFWLDSRDFKEQIRVLKEDVDHARVAAACRALLDAPDRPPKLEGKIGAADAAFAQLPDAVRTLPGVTSVEIDAGAGLMRIQFGGGFAQCGYEVWKPGLDAHIKPGKENPGGTLYEPLVEGMWWFVQP